MFFLCFLDVAVNCGSLARPSNGWIQKKTGETFGALHLFKCNEAEGYLMRGSKERRCLANATWSGVQPVCYREFSDHNLYATFLTLSCVVASFPFRRVKQQLVRKANKEPIFPTVQTCDAPRKPVHGKLASKPSKKYFFGNVVEYQCNNGFSPRGHETTRCQIHGNWSNPAPICLSKLKFFNIHLRILHNFV